MATCLGKGRKGADHVDFGWMPELPEVETIRRLLPDLEGRVVRRVLLSLPRLLEGCAPDELARLEGLRCAGIERHGKYLLARFGEGSPAHALVIHLGMSGQLTWKGAGEPVVDRFRRLPSGLAAPLGAHSVDRHTHLRIVFQDGGELLFRDPRTFGRLLLAPVDAVAELPRLARLGPDALGIAESVFRSRWKEFRGARSVKAILLDQGFLAGIGNIYADEACHEALIRPGVRSSTLTAARVGKLARAVQAALLRGLDNCGTTFRDFVHPDGSHGGNQEDLRVYARGGKPCLSCGTTLRKGVVAGRGTVWCPRCQA
jgi:formamidopyrimidine-DNA glycosylase